MYREAAVGPGGGLESLQGGCDTAKEDLTDLSILSAQEPNA